MSGTALVHSSADDLDRARRWAQMDPHARRREAFRACRDRDIDALWRLTEIFLHLHSGAGVNLSKYTSRNYRQALHSFVEDMRDEKLSDPSPTAAAVWRETLRERQLKPSTIKVRLAAVRAMYKALKWATTIQVPEGKQAPTKIDVELWRNLKPPKDPVPAHAKRRPYTEPEVDAMLRVSNAMERVMVLLGSHAGLRIGEMLSLQWESIDLDGMLLAVECGKGRKRREVVVSRTLAEALRDYGISAGYVLPHRTNVWGWKVVTRVAERAGVSSKGRGFHSLRHSCGTRLYKQTKKLEVCQKMLGHSDISTTQVYTHWGNEELENAVGNW